MTKARAVNEDDNSAEQQRQRDIYYSYRSMAEGPSVSSQQPPPGGHSSGIGTQENRHLDQFGANNEVSHNAIPTISAQCNSHNVYEVSRETYHKACDLLFHKYSEAPLLTGDDRQEIQQIKHGNDKRQPRPNKYSGPEDKNAEAEAFMNNIKEKYGLN